MTNVRNSANVRLSQLSDTTKGTNQPMLDVSTPSNLLRYITDKGFQSGVVELTNTKDLVAIHDLNDPHWDSLRPDTFVIPFLVGEDFDYLLAVLNPIKDYATNHGLHALDAMAIVGDRWRSAFCEEPTCCPPEGKTFRD